MRKGHCPSCTNLFFYFYKALEQEGEQSKAIPAATAHQHMNVNTEESLVQERLSDSSQLKRVTARAWIGQWWDLPFTPHFPRASIFLGC